MSLATISIEERNQILADRREGAGIKALATRYHHNVSAVREVLTEGGLPPPEPKPMQAAFTKSSTAGGADVVIEGVSVKKWRANCIAWKVQEGCPKFTAAAMFGGDNLPEPVVEAIVTSYVAP